MKPSYQCSNCHNIYDGEKPTKCKGCKQKKFDFIGYSTSFPSQTDLQILKDPGLFKVIVEESGKREPVELEARKAITILVSGRFVENFNAESFNALVNGPSGSGKDHLIKTMLDLLVPSDEKECLSGSSPKYLRYAHSNEEDFSWDGKVIYLEDVSQDTLDSEAFKVHLSGKGTKTGVVDNGKAIELKINGKAVIICTTAHSNLNNEGLRRLIVIPVTASEEKIRYVLNFQAKEDAQQSGLDYHPNILSALSKLNRVKVALPFGDNLAARFPTKNIIAMSVHARFRDWVKACAALHQYQREKDDLGRIVATREDYEIARESFLYCASGNIKPITMNQRTIMDALRNAVTENVSGYCPLSSFQESIPMTRSTIYKNLEKLVEAGFVLENKIPVENNRYISAYKVVPENFFTLPTYDELFDPSISSSGGIESVVSMANEALPSSERKRSPNLSSKAEAILTQLQRYANGPKVPIAFLESAGVYDDEVVRLMKKDGIIYEPVSGFLQISRGN